MSLDRVDDEEEFRPYHLLFGEIDEESARETCEWLLEASFSDDAPSTLTLVINSPGGSLAGGFAITDMIRASQLKVRTVGVGQIQSAGLLIFMAGTKGERVLTPNTTIMSHQYSWGSGGKHHELIAATKEFKLTHERMLEHYKLHTNLREKEISRILLPAEDVFLSAEEALKYGICDRIAFLNKTV